MAWPKLAELVRQREALWLGFDAGTRDLAVTAAEAPSLGPAQGRRTDIARALEQGLQRTAARPLAGVVLMTDGRTPNDPPPALVRRLQADHVPLITVPLGSADPVEDFAVAGADAPAVAFVNDPVPVAVQVDRLGGRAGDPPPAGARVQLIDKATGMVLADEPLPTDAAAWSGSRARVLLTSASPDAGRRGWVVRVATATPDLVQTNNQAEVSVEFVDRPMRVLYIDGYPRWEYRYLKNLLLREKSIRSGSLLLASDRRFISEGDSELAFVPRSPEEWARFDAVILGDVSGSVFSAEQLQQLREHVATRGAGLLWIGGPSATPRSWWATPLADLLPFSPVADSESSSERGVRAWPEAVVMRPTAAAERLGLLALSDVPGEPWPARLSDPATGWSQLQYAQRIDPRSLKPTAEVLATATPISAAGGVSGSSGAASMSGPGGGGESSGWPLVLSMRYGAGRVLYVATDEVWRWRYARGEALPERFWLPLLRLQGRESLARSSRSAIFDVSPRRSEVDRPVRVSVQLVDQSLLDAAPGALTVRVVRQSAGAGDAEGGGSGQTISLTPEPAGGTGRSYAATWLPSEAGVYKLEVTDPLLARATPAVEAQVLLPNDEFATPQTDHALLARLSAATEGAVLPVDRLAELPGLLRNRQLRIAGVPDAEALWDKPVVLIVFLVLLTMEWVGRRVIKLA